MKTEIREFLSEHIPNHELQDNDDFFDMGLVNSLFAMQLVLFIEQEFDVEITAQQWKELSPLQRFALIKLSRRGHENRNFYPALQEFKLV